MNTQLMFSSETVEWSTPQWLFDLLNKHYRFTLDPCATAENAKCSKFYTKEDNGLIADWSKDSTFMNPPYGEDEWPCKLNCKKKKCEKRGHHCEKYTPGCYQFVEKAYKTGVAGGLVVGLLPNRSDTRWYQHFIEHVDPSICRVTVIRLPGRITFGNAPNPAPFPSIVVVWDGPFTRLLHYLHEK